MKRIFALLLAFSLMLSLTLPAYAEEAVEQIAEEIAEEVAEEVIELPEEELIEEEITEEFEEEVAEEVAEEIMEQIDEEAQEQIVEEVAEEILPELTVGAVSDEAAAAEAEPANQEPDPDDYCPYCNDGTLIRNCREADHWGGWLLWLHMVDNSRSFLRNLDVFQGRSMEVYLMEGNWMSQDVIPDAGEFLIYTWNEEAEIKWQENSEALTITVSDPIGNDIRPVFTITANQPGKHMIKYIGMTDPEPGFNELVIDVLAEDEKIFYATKDNGEGYFFMKNPLTMQPNRNGGNIFWLDTAEGPVRIDPAELYSTTENIRITYTPGDENCIAYVSLAKSTRGMIRYQDENGRFYSIPTFSYDASGNGYIDDVPELLITDADGSNPRYSQQITVGQELECRFRLGSSGASIPVWPNFGEPIPEGWSVQETEEGHYVICSEAVGSLTVSYGNSTMTIHCVEAVVGEEMLFMGEQWTDETGNNVRSYLELSLQDSFGEEGYFNTEFLFGTGFDDCISAKVETAILGDSIALRYNGEYDGHHYYGIKPLKEGYSLITYKAANGLSYCLPVKVVNGYDNSNFMARNYVQFNDVTAGIAVHLNETPEYYSQFGDYYHPGSNSEFSRTISLLVRDQNGYVAPERLSDVSFQVLSCVDNDQNPNNAVSLSAVHHYSEPETGLTAKSVRIRGKADTTFRATVAVSYTLDNEKRFTQQILLWRSATLSDVELHADDLTDAGKLNVALSSWEALVAWAQDQHGVTIIPGAAIHLYLPPVSYDEVIVAQAMSPMNYNNPQPISLINLHGTSGPEGRTTMCGLVEKASLVWIGMIDFVADKHKTMTTTGSNQKFTCGILTDYRADIQDVAYDEGYLEKYCGGATPSQELPADRISQYGQIFNTAIDLGTVQNCTFTGFDYGVRATPYGYVGAQAYNEYNDCYYGMYIDNDGSKYAGGDYGADAGNATNTDYTYLTFENNHYAVRIVSMPTDASDYRVRVHDSNFINNHREFWIDEPGTFFFYRNYFGGKWQENDKTKNWSEHSGKKPTLDDLDVTFIVGEHRPGRVHYEKGDAAAAETLIVTNPCRRTTDFHETIYWFYGGEDQHTIIELGDNSMPISGEAMEALTEDAQITVVDDNGDVIKYNFKGKGNNNGNGKAGEQA